MAIFDVPKRTGPEDKTPEKFMTATARRLVNMGMSLPAHIVQSGRQWYPRVHDIARSAVGLETVEGRRIGSTATASGIIAAVSPNLEFEERNAHALSQLGNLDTSDWEMVKRSSEAKQPGTSKQAPRHPEVTAMLKEKAPSLSASYDSGLLKAHRLLSGEQLHDVLPLSTAPKTHHFALNILNPHEDTGVTVDFRHHDIVANQMLPPKMTGRGISSAGLKTPGRTTRYEDIENITRMATKRISKMDERFQGIQPHDMQAILWMGGKHIETLGGARKVGVARKGQPYTTPTGRPLPRDAHFWTGAGDHL